MGTLINNIIEKDIKVDRHSPGASSENNGSMESLLQVTSFARFQSLLIFEPVGRVEICEARERSIPKVLSTIEPSSIVFTMWVTPFLVIINFVGKPHLYKMLCWRSAVVMGARRWRALIVNWDRSAKSFTLR